METRVVLPSPRDSSPLYHLDCVMNYTITYYERGQNIATQTPINAILPPDMSPISGFVPSNNQPNA